MSTPTRPCRTRARRSSLRSTTRSSRSRRQRGLDGIEGAPCNGGESAPLCAVLLGEIPFVLMSANSASFCSTHKPRMTAAPHRRSLHRRSLGVIRSPPGGLVRPSSRTRGLCDSRTAGAFSASALSTLAPDRGAERKWRTAACASEPTPTGTTTKPTRSTPVSRPPGYGHAQGSHQLLRGPELRRRCSGPSTQPRGLVQTVRQAIGWRARLHDNCVAPSRVAWVRRCPQPRDGGCPFEVDRVRVPHLVAGVFGGSCRACPIAGRTPSKVMRSSLGPRRSALRR